MQNIPAKPLDRGCAMVQGSPVRWRFSVLPVSAPPPLSGAAGRNGVLRLHASLADSTQAGGEVWRDQRSDTKTGFE